MWIFNIEPYQSVSDFGVFFTSSVPASASVYLKYDIFKGLDRHPGIFQYYTETHHKATQSRCVNKFHFRWLKPLATYKGGVLD